MQKLHIFCLALFCLASLFHVQAQDDALPPLITVTGNGEVRQAPEQVVVTLGIQIREKTIEGAVNKTDQASADIISYLRGQDIAAEDIQTTYLNLSPQYTSTGADYGSTEIDYYSSQKTVTFTLRNISAYDDVLNGLYDAGVNNVQSVSFEIENVQDQRLEARRLAVSNATAAAQLLADALNVTLDGVYSITDQTYDEGENPGPFLPDAIGIASEASAGSAASSGPSVSGGEISIDASVQVSFYIAQ